jgi:hypothetical protein
MLSLGILGRFALTGPEGPVALPSDKLDALLAYLALALDPVPRDELRTLLWGSHFDSQADRKFRQALVIELDRKFAAAYGVAARGFSQRKPVRMVSKPARSPTVLKARILKGGQQ